MVTINIDKLLHNMFGTSAYKKEYKLMHQLMVVLMSISIIPMIIFGIITYKNTVSEIETSKITTLKAYSQGMTKNIETQIESAGNIIKGLSSHMDLIFLLENFNHNSKLVEKFRLSAIEGSLKSTVAESSKLYEAIIVTDAKGKIVIEGSKKGKTYLNKPYLNMEEYNQIVNGNNTFVGDPFISPVSGELVMPVSRAITKGPVIGTMTIIYNLHKFSAAFESAKLGKTGQMMIINKKDIIVYHSNSKLVNSKSENRAIDQIQHNNKDFGDVKDFKEGVSKAMYYFKSPSSGWLICTFIDNSELMRPVYSFTTYIVITLLILLILSSTISYLYSKHLNTPIKKLINLMKQVEEGKLDITEDYTVEIHELRMLKSGFFDMTAKIKKLIGDMGIAALGISNTAEEMSSASQSSLSHAEETVSAATKILEDTKHQTNNIKGVTQSMEGLSQQINITQSYSCEINSFAHNISLAAEKGTILVDQLEAKSLYNIKNTEAAEESLNTLVAQINDIKRITRTITNISKQTNLLALNASIEAAKVGEIGSGFSVVASQVKSLSEQTKNEANVINDLIKNITNNSLCLESIMNKTTNAAIEQNEAVINTKTVFLKIFDNIKEIVAKTTKISQYLEDMSGSKNDVLFLMTKACQISAETNGVAESVKTFTNSQIYMIQEVHNLADSLNQLAVDLNCSIHKLV